MSLDAAPATVTWWEGEQDHVSAWLTVKAGSPPLEREAWLAQLAVEAPGPGGWAVVSAVPLGGIDRELSARLLVVTRYSRREEAPIVEVRRPLQSPGAARAELRSVPHLAQLHHAHTSDNSRRPSNPPLGAILLRLNWFNCHGVVRGFLTLLLSSLTNKNVRYGLRT